MENLIKQRLVGAAVIVSLGVIFLPMLLDGGRHTDFEKIQVEIPVRPSPGFTSVIEPITPPRSEPAEVAPELVDDIDQAGQAPVVDDEIAKIMKPIEVPPEAIIKSPEPDKPAESTGLAKPETTKKPEPAIAKPTESVPPPEKATAKPGSPVSAWVIQVGSFDSRENAVKLRDRLRKQGFIAFVESFMTAGKASHRVRVGPEADRTKAEKTLEQLRQKLSLSGIVVSYP